MATITRSIYQAAADTRALALTAGEALSVSANAIISARGTGSTSYGILAAGGNPMTIAGDVFSLSAAGIQTAAGNNTITLAATASVLSQATYAMLLAGTNNVVVNRGDLTSLNFVTVEFTDGAGGNRFNNTGVVRANAANGVNMVGSTNVFSNSGTIETNGDFYAVLTGGQATNTGTLDGGIYLTGGGTNTFLNSGTVLGRGVFIPALRGGVGVENIVNNGTIQHVTGIAVQLGLENDVYDGRGGRAIGAVEGQGGNDTLLGGAFADKLSGGDENDLLNGGGGLDTLDGGAGNDTFLLGADNDTVADVSGIDTIASTITRSLVNYGAIERLVLQGAAAINGTGNAVDNFLFGNGAANGLVGLGGTDTIFGGGGNDQIFGQAARDLLRGQGGDDTFVYQVQADSLAGATSDIILDFDDVGNDRINLAGVFGPALVYRGAFAFSGIGQVRINDIAGPDLIVEVNLSGNATPEMQIYLQGTTLAMMGVDDFVL